MARTDDKARDEAPQPLRRLGGGRWATRDGRFTIEPQGGTWVVVDAEQLDELGLPRVRGPFGSLGDAREAIETLRDRPAEASPLAAHLERAPALQGDADTDDSEKRDRETPSDGDAPTSPPGRPRPGKADRTTAPKRPPLPAWLQALPEDQRRSARALIADAERAGLANAEALVRAELETDRPAIAGALLLRRLREVAAEDDSPPEEVVRRVLEVIAEGGDPAWLRLPGWRLVDERGRQLTVEPDPLD